MVWDTQASGYSSRNFQENKAPIFLHKDFMMGRAISKAKTIYNLFIEIIKFLPFLFELTDVFLIGTPLAFIGIHGLARYQNQTG